MNDEQILHIQRSGKLSQAVAYEVVKQTEWTPDCQGKFDFDITLFSLSTRYYSDNTAYATLYLSTEGGDEVCGIELAKFKSEPGNQLGAPSAKDELEAMARTHIQKFVNALLQAADPEVVKEAFEKAGMGNVV